MIELRCVSRSLAFALAMPLGSAAFADVIVVNPFGLGDAPSIQAGVDIASEGDVVLIDPGTYPESVIVASKGICLVAAQPRTVQIDGDLTIESIDRGSQVTVSGLMVEAPSTVSGDGRTALFVRDSQGVVHLHASSFAGGCTGVIGVLVPLVAGGVGAEFNGARRLVATDCMFLGSSEALTHGFPTCQSSTGGFGLELDGSRAALWNCQAQGGNGFFVNVINGSIFSIPGDGGAGCRLSSSELFFSGGRISGGDGGRNDDFLALPGGQGGDGLVADAASRAFLQSAPTTGGDGGPSAAGSGGLPGQAFTGAGSTRFLPGNPGTHGAAEIALSSGSLDLSVRGNPGSSATLYLLQGPPPFIFDTFETGPGLVSAPSIGRSELVGSLGAIPASGKLNVTLPIPAIPVNTGAVSATFVVRTGRSLRGMALSAPVPVIVINCSSALTDCNGNGRSDLCELLDGSQVDLNGNGRIDDCDP